MRTFQSKILTISAVAFNKCALAFIIFLLSLPICAQVTQDKISGVWKTNVDKTMTSMSDDIKTKFQNYGGSALQDLKNVLATQKHFFEVNGDYKSSGSFGSESTGKWVLNDEKLTITHLDGESKSYSILSCTDDEIVMELVSGQVSKVIFSKLTLSLIERK